MSPPPQDLFVKVTYDYEPQKPDELLLAAGDRIRVIDNNDPSWWYGERTGSLETGWFPANFAEVCEPPYGTPSAPRAAGDDGAEQSRRSSIASSVGKAGGSQESISASGGMPRLARVLYDFEANGPDELSLRTGSVLTLISFDTGINGWYKGDCHGAIGIFPANHIKMIDGSEPNLTLSAASSSSAAAEHTVQQSKEKKLSQYGVKMGGIGSLFAGGISSLKRNKKKDTSNDELAAQPAAEQQKVDMPSPAMVSSPPSVATEPEPSQQQPPVASERRLSQVSSKSAGSTVQQPRAQAPPARTLPPEPMAEQTPVVPELPKKPQAVQDPSQPVATTRVPRRPLPPSPGPNVTVGAEEKAATPHLTGDVAEGQQPDAVEPPTSPAKPKVMRGVPLPGAVALPGISGMVPLRPASSSPAAAARPKSGHQELERTGSTGQANEESGATSPVPTLPASAVPEEQGTPRTTVFTRPKKPLALMQKDAASSPTTPVIPAPAKAMSPPPATPAATSPPMTVASPKPEAPAAATETPAAVTETRVENGDSHAEVDVEGLGISEESSTTGAPPAEEVAAPAPAPTVEDHGDVETAQETEQHKLMKPLTKARPAQMKKKPTSAGHLPQSTPLEVEVVPEEAREVAAPEESKAETVTATQPEPPSRENTASPVSTKPTHGRTKSGVSSAIAALQVNLEQNVKMAMPVPYGKPPPPLTRKPVLPTSPHLAATRPAVDVRRSTSPGPVSTPPLAASDLLDMRQQLQTLSKQVGELSTMLREERQHRQQLQQTVARLEQQLQLQPGSE
ncbi:hypothetical protein RI367_005686 [Sorochytrium milnesiophthora]